LEVARPLDCHGNFDTARFDGKRHATLGPHLKASDDGFLDVILGFLTSFALADASRDGRAFGNPCTVLVSVEVMINFIGSS
jgi:hypothetical protein